MRSHCRTAAPVSRKTERSPCVISSEAAATRWHSREIFGKSSRESYTVCLATRTVSYPRAAGQRPVRLRGGCAAAPLRVTQRDKLTFQQSKCAFQSRAFGKAPPRRSSRLRSRFAPRGNARVRTPLLLFPKISLRCDFREPCCRILATQSGKSEFARFFNRRSL